MKSKIQLALACVATLGLAVACGRGDSKQNASIKQLKQEEVISQGLKDSFPGYDPMDVDNITLASRLLGATLEPLAQNPKTDKLDAALKFKVTMLLEKPDLQISASGVATEKIAESLTLDKGENDAAPAGYALQARCLSTSGCNHVLVLLINEIAAGSDTNANTSAAPATPAATADLLPVSNGTGSVDIPTQLVQKKQAKVAMQFSRQSNGSYALVWSASTTIGDFVNGGTKKSVEQAKADRAAAGKVAAPAAKAPESQATQPQTTTPPSAPATAQQPQAAPAPAATTPQSTAQPPADADPTADN